MYSSITLALFSAIVVSSAIPTHPSYIRNLPRQNATEVPAVCNDGSPVFLGGSLDAEAAAESHQLDESADPAFSGIPIKTSDNRCLTIDPCGGDFRQNLIPVQTAKCDANDKRQLFDIVTKGKHIKQEGGMLVVSQLTKGCLNFDDRKRVPNIFSCGGRAGGEGTETPAQVFSFTAGQKSLPLKLPLELKGKGEETATTCLVGANGKIGFAGCSDDNSQVFTLG
ncbi:MAG: hypothetical protein Q9226_001890 [Calogaya cf. arnoldii]